MTTGQHGSLLVDATIHGPPVGKARARIVKSANGGSHGFTPEGTDTWEGNAIGVIAEIWGSVQRYKGGVRLDVVAVAKRPKKLYRKRDPSGRIYRMAKPDGDNVLKIVGDCLKKAFVLVDDVQVVIWHEVQLYGAKHETPKVEIAITAIDTTQEVCACLL